MLLKKEYVKGNHVTKSSQNFMLNPCFCIIYIVELPALNLNLYRDDIGLLTL